MKILAFAFVVLMAGANALPSLHVEQAIRSGQERLVTDSIASAIADISQAIVDAGLDPLAIEHEAINYALPVPSIFNVRAHLKDLLFKGASNIVIKQLNLNVIALRLTFNIELPEILLNIVDSEVDANIFGKNLNGRFSGRVTIKNIVLTGNIRMNVGIISGISIRDIDLTFNLGSIDSQLNLFLQYVNLSGPLNTALGVTIPATLKDFELDINKLITIVAKDVIESFL